MRQLKERHYSSSMLLVRKEERILLNRNIDLKNRHKGERCFILATGPSIQKQDIEVLKNEICISVSNFFVHRCYGIIRPRYHCIAPYHPPITEDAWTKWMWALRKSVVQTELFFDIADRFRNEMIFDGKPVHYLKFGGQSEIIVESPIDITRRMPTPQSVSIMAIYVALYMGFSEIYLLGCDHDWILHLNVSRHFYSETEHELVKSGYNEWFGGDFGSYCQDYVNLWRQYKAINDMARICSSEIYNATAGGLLDVFPRVDLKEMATCGH